MALLRFRMHNKQTSIDRRCWIKHVISSIYFLVPLFPEKRVKLTTGSLLSPKTTETCKEIPEEVLLEVHQVLLNHHELLLSQLLLTLVPFLPFDLLLLQHLHLDLHLLALPIVHCLQRARPLAVHLQEQLLVATTADEVDQLARSIGEEVADQQRLVEVDDGRHLGRARVLDLLVDAVAGNDEGAEAVPVHVLLGDGYPVAVGGGQGVAAGDETTRH